MITCPYQNCLNYISFRSFTTILTFYYRREAKMRNEKFLELLLRFYIFDKRSRLLHDSLTLKQNAIAFTVLWILIKKLSSFEKVTSKLSRAAVSLSNYVTTMSSDLSDWLFYFAMSFIPLYKFFMFEEHAKIAQMLIKLRLEFIIFIALCVAIYVHDRLTYSHA